MQPTRRSLSITSAGHATADLRRAVLELAVIWGWHVPDGGHARTSDLPGLVFARRRPNETDPGWPDLTLVRRRDRRLIFAGLVQDRSRGLSPIRNQVLDMLRSLEWEAATRERQIVEAALGHSVPVVQTFVWRTRDLLDGAVDEALR